MDILIKGMDMPTNCGDCYFEQVGAEEDVYGEDVYGDTCISYCLLTEWRIALSNRDDMKLPSCPLVEIPTPHGRLIDETTIQGALIAEAYKNDGKFQFGDTIKWTPSEVEEIVSNSVPTILESEE